MRQQWNPVLSLLLYMTIQQQVLSVNIFALPFPTPYLAMIGDQSWSSHGRNVSVGQWAASHVLTGLTPHLTYAVRLMAHNDLGVSQPSPLQMFTTTEEGKCTPC